MSKLNVFDVAAYILNKTGPMTHMKLQKLVYYAQAWSLVWDETPLFREKIEAWANGPVVPRLYQELRGQFKIPRDALDHLRKCYPDDTQKETLDSVLEYYNPRSSQYLSDLTHLESPWREARNGLAPDERGANEITHEMLAEYYGSLTP